MFGEYNFQPGNWWCPATSPTAHHPGSERQGPQGAFLDKWPLPALHPKPRPLPQQIKNGATQPWGSGASALSNFNVDAVLLNSTVHWVIAPLLIQQAEHGPRRESGVSGSRERNSSGKWAQTSGVPTGRMGTSRDPDTSGSDAGNGLVGHFSSKSPNGYASLRANPRSWQWLHGLSPHGAKDPSHLEAYPGPILTPSRTQVRAFVRNSLLPGSHRAGSHPLQIFVPLPSQRGQLGLLCLGWFSSLCSVFSITQITSQLTKIIFYF